MKSGNEEKEEKRKPGLEPEKAQGKKPSSKCKPFTFDEQRSPQDPGLAGAPPLHTETDLILAGSTLVA